MAASDGTGQGKRKILVVEDEPGFLAFVAAELRHLGYDVTAVTSGPDALHHFSVNDSFDLLFTDIALPDGVSGLELARRARRAFGRGLKVLLTSAYSRDEVLELHGEPEEDMPLLRKPYKREDLAKAVQTALGAT